MSTIESGILYSEKGLNKMYDAEKIRRDNQDMGKVKEFLSHMVDGTECSGDIVERYSLPDGSFDYYKILKDCLWTIQTKNEQLDEWGKYSSFLYAHGFLRD